VPFALVLALGNLREGAHGGRLWADTNEPRGAVFQFTLPGAES
jgi:signal transduction histidine kinase